MIVRLKSFAPLDFKDALSTNLLVPHSESVISKGVRVTDITDFGISRFYLPVLGGRRGPGRG